MQFEKLYARSANCVYLLHYIRIIHYLKNKIQTFNIHSLNTHIAAARR